MITNADILVSCLENIFPTASCIANDNGNVIIQNIPGDKHTVQYGFYFHNDGIRIRRMIHLWIGENRYYQLNRNSHIGYWPAFSTITEAVNWFEGYITRNASKH